jgi:hypothetical protein
LPDFIGATNQNGKNYTKMATKYQMTIKHQNGNKNTQMLWNTPSFSIQCLQKHTKNGRKINRLATLLGMKIWGRFYSRGLQL